MLSDIFSIPLILEVTGYPKSADAGTIKLGVDYTPITSNFVFDGTAISTHIEATDTFPGIDMGRRDAKFIIPVNTLLPGQQMMLSVYRMPSDPEDTLDANIVIQNVRVIGHFWKN